MLRGTTQFKCHKCGKTFKAPDIELGATMLSQPQPCPVCGSRHTYPSKIMLVGPLLYRDIWKQYNE